MNHIQIHTVLAKLESSQKLSFRINMIQRIQFQYRWRHNATEGIWFDSLLKAIVDNVDDTA